MERQATIEGIRRYTIHGEPYAIVYFSHDSGRDVIEQAQMSADAFPEGLRPGDTVVISYIGSIVVGINRA